MSTPSTGDAVKAAADAPLMLSVSGCRGIVGSSLTPERVARFVASALCWARSKRTEPGSDQAMTVVLARDGRVGGAAIALSAAGALAAAGCRVVDLGVATTPTAGLMVRRLNADLGLVITASHNPAPWNGLKVLSAAGGAPMLADANDIVARFKSDAAPWPWVGSDRAGVLERNDSGPRLHVETVLGALEKLTPLRKIREKCFRVVLDSVNASGASAGRMLLESLGCLVVHLHAETSGVFPHTPEPTRENLTGLCDAVRTHKAAVGFAQDPDADRLALIDESGAYVGEEYTLALGVKSWLSMLSPERARGQKVAANLSTSRMIDDVAASFGASVVRTAVGEANVVEGMHRAGCLMGGEGNGGLIWPEVVPIRDSLVSMAFTLALMARTGKTLSACAVDTPAYAIVKRKIDVREGLAARAVAAVTAHYRAKNASLSDLDGVRADFPIASGGSGWVHVRASNTEPIIRLIAEAPRADQAEGVLDEVGAIVAKC
ncbi:MAG: phosphoglucosamine mutase [Phycisphaerales bacterium]